MAGRGRLSSGGAGGSERAIRACSSRRLRGGAPGCAQWRLAMPGWSCVFVSDVTTRLWLT
eukprot:7466954-Heterocapsa_arctica.AAC.1